MTSNFNSKGKQMPTKGCCEYLASIVDITKKVIIELSYVCIVCKFPDVFPEELPILSLDREIELEIELLPGTMSISKAPS